MVAQAVVAAAGAQEEATGSACHFLSLPRVITGAAICWKWITMSGWPTSDAAVLS